LAYAHALFECVGIFMEKGEKVKKIEVITRDDQFALPMVFGTTKKNPYYPFPTATGITVTWA
jgi:hypothetical protein